MRQAGLSAVLLAAGLAACGDKHHTWREEVELPGGAIVVVQRGAELRANYIPGGGGGSINEGMTLAFVSPAAPDNPAAWSGKYVPILLDRDPASREWAIVATFFHCDTWYALGRPKLPYTEFRFRQGRWVQQDLSSQWVGRVANVLAYDGSERFDYLDLKRKQAIVEERPAIAPEYKRVVDQWGTGC